MNRKGQVLPKGPIQTFLAAAYYLGDKLDKVVYEPQKGGNLGNAIYFLAQENTISSSPKQAIGVSV